MKKLFFSLCFLLAITATAQVVRPFTVRKTITQKGGIVYLSNSSSKAAPDNIVQNEMPPAGTGYDNNFNNTYIDIDADASTWMSSSDQLNLPSCTAISWAGLYWGGDCSTGDENFATRNQVKIKADNGSYVNLTADFLQDNTVGFRTYHCFKDISSIIQSHAMTSTYTVANVATDIGAKNLFGGWTIVIIYQNNTMMMRNLTVFDGLASVSSGTYSTVDIPISGFQTPLAGPVSFELGLVVYDGDRSLTGDQLLFRGVTSFVNISDALHPSTDVFNSTLSKNGTLTPYRNPSYNNTLGYDANIFVPNNSAKNYIGNNAISATIRQTTGGETFLTQVVTSAIDVYEPDLRSAVRVANITHPGNPTAQPGDILEYTVNGLNIGSDPSINTYVTDTIEGNAQYVPGSLQIIYGPNLGAKTDVAGDDQGEYIAASKAVRVRIGNGANNFLGGLVNNSPSGLDSTVFKFRVQATTDCVYLSCDNVIDNSSHINGTGNVSGNSFSNASTPGIFDIYGCPVIGTTQTPINVTGCTAPTASANAPICQGGNLDFTASYSASATYSWTGPNGFTSTQREPTISNVTSANTGTYIANIYITGTTCHFVIPVVAQINISNAGPDQSGISTCGLTTVTLAGNSPPSTTGLWTITAGVGGSFGSGHTATSTTANSTFNGVAGNSYTLTWALSSLDCPTTTDNVVITFSSAPSLAVLSATSVTCANHLNVAITGGSSPYTVVIDNGVGTITNYISGNNISVSPASTTQYNLVSVTSANGCVATTLSGNPSSVTINNSMGTGIITANNPPSGSYFITAAQLPTVSATVSGNGTWTNTNNALTDNAQDASATNNSSGNTQYLYLRGFGFAIPVGAVIDGLIVTLDKHASGTVTDSRISLVNTTSSQGSNKTNSGNWPAIEATSTYGSATDLWGNTSGTITPTMVNSANFGIRVRANLGTSNATAYVDVATMKIYYHTGTTEYCDNTNNASFTVSGFTNATFYTWTPPSGASIVSGQGTTTAVFDFNGAGQSGYYSVMVTPSNACGAGTPATLSIPIIDCANGGTLSFLGNVFWDVNGTTAPQRVDGTGVGTVNASQLYVTLARTTGTAPQQVSLSTVPVNANGTYTLSGTFSSSTGYRFVLSTTNYANGTALASVLPTLSPTTATYLGEINNDLTNSITGNDGTVNGIINFTTPSSFTNNETNLNFSIKIPTAPTANNDATSTNEDVAVSFNIASNDFDVDGTINASTVILSTANSNGTWSVNSSALVTYTPALNFNGTASITYTIKDNDNLTSNSATITVTVNPVNDPPVATASVVTTPENTTYTFSAGNFLYTDIESNLLSSITIASLPGLGTLNYNNIAVTIGQTILVANIPLLTYIPTPNSFGSPFTTFTFKANDLNLGTVAGTMTINVTHVNVAPTAVNDLATTNQNVPVTFNILTNDINVDGTLVTSSVDLDPLAPLQQTTITIPGEGTFTDNGSGVITFTPVALFYGTTTTIHYTVNNSFSLTSNAAAINVIVIPFGAPIAVNDAATTNENTSITFSVTNNDTDDGTIDASRVDLDPLTIGIQQAYYISGQGQFSVDILGNVTFVPDWNFFGTVTTTYTVKDNLGLVSNIATITVNVLWANANPFAIDDFETTNEDVPVTFNVLPNDYDLDGTIAINSVDLNPSLVGIQTSVSVSGEGTYTADNSGNVTFTPVLNFNGSITPKSYCIKDNLGSVSDSALIYISVTPINDAPVAVNDIATANGTTTNASISFSVVSNDNDVDGTINASTVDLDPFTNGVQTTFTVSGEGVYTVDNLGNITFTYTFATPVGTLTPIHYTVNDNSGAISNNATITITVLSPGIPFAVSDAVSTNEDTPISFDVTSNDVDNNGIDAASLTLIGTLITANGTWSITDAVNSPGYVTFVPAANFFGTVTLNYSVNDYDPLTSNIVSITVNVLPVNDAPSFTVGANQSMCINSGVQIVNLWANSMSAGPANESAQSLSFIVTNNNNALFTSQPAVDALGNLSYESATNQSGSAVVSVRIADSGGTSNGGIDLSAIQTFTITISSFPTVVTTTPAARCDAGTLSLSATGSAGTLNWYNVATGGTSLGTGTTFTTPSISSTTTYYVEATNNSCTSGRTAVIATINATPSVLTTTPAARCDAGTLSLSATGSAGTLDWYNVSTGGTSLGTGTTFTTPSISTTTTYYVEATNNSCTSGRTAVIATVNATPSVLTTTPATICDAGTVTLTASASAGALNWFNVPTGGISLGTGTTFTTPSISSTTTFYVEATNNSCTSTRTAVVATVNNSPISIAGIDQNLCNVNSVSLSGNTPTQGTGNWTMVSGPNTPVISNPTSANTSVTSLIEGTYIFEWTISNAPCVASSDQVQIIIAPIPTIANAGTDQNLCNNTTTTLSGNTPVAGNGTWTLVSGPNSPTLTNASSPNTSVTGLIAGTYIFDWSIASSPCNTSSDQLQITIAPNPTTANAGTDQNLCNNTTASLTGNTPVSGNGIWSFVSGPNSPSITNSSSTNTTVTGLVAGTYIFDWTIASSPCSASSDQTQIIIDPLPTVSNAGPDQNICANGVSLWGNTPINGNGLWTFVAGPGVPVINNATNALASVTGMNSAGAYTFVWTISSGSCQSSTDTVVISTTATSIASNAGNNQTICSQSASLSGNVPSSGNGIWSLYSGPGTATFTNASSASSSVTVSVSGTYEFEWTISNPPCASSTDIVQVIFDTLPSVANAGVDQIICSSQASLLALPITIGTGTWSILNGPSSPVITTPNSTTSTITGMTTSGSYNFIWTVTNGVCASSSDTITISNQSISIPVFAGVDGQFCSTTTALDASDSHNNTGTWSLLSGPGTATFANANDSASAVTVSAIGNYNFVWTISNGQCNSSDTVAITFDGTTTIANAGIDQVLCNSTTATLNANAPTIGIGQWSQISGPSSASIVSASSPTSTINNLIAGTYIFEWNITNGICTSSANQVQIVITPAPTIANAGADQIICANGVALWGNTPVTGNGLWTSASGPVTPTISNDTNALASVTGMNVAGTYVFVWTISNGICQASSDSVTVFTTATTVAADAGINQNVCGQTASLAGNIPSGGIGTWTLYSGPGTAIFTDTTNALSAVDVSTSGTYEFEWTISNPPCAGSTDIVQITFDAPPSIAIAGADQNICNSQATLIAGQISIGTGTWSFTNGPTTPTFSNANADTTVINGMTTSGSYFFVWTVTNGVCPSSSDTVVVTNQSIANVANAGNDVQVCDTAIILNGSDTHGNIGVWTILNGNGTATFGNSNDSTTTVSVSSTGNYNFIWTITNGICSSSDTVSITFNGATTIANAGTDLVLCQSTTSNLNANTPIVGVGQWTQVSGPSTANILSPNSPVSAVDNLVDGTYLFEWTITNGTCTSNSDQVQIIILPPPSQAYAGVDSSSICAPHYVMTGVMPTNGTGVWNQISGPSTVLFADSSNAQVEIYDLIAGDYVFTYAVSSGICSATSDTVYLNVVDCNSDVTLFVPSGFSPNNDGVNDYFEIVGINAYPQNKVTIFNRWGNILFDEQGYDNANVRWNGENKNSLSTGNGYVPEGTYFYMIDLGDGSALLSGYIFVNRK